MSFKKQILKTSIECYISSENRPKIKYIHKMNIHQLKAIINNNNFDIDKFQETYNNILLYAYNLDGQKLIEIKQTIDNPEIRIDENIYNHLERKYLKILKRIKKYKLISNIDIR